MGSSVHGSSALEVLMLPQLLRLRLLHFLQLPMLLQVQLMMVTTSWCNCLGIAAAVGAAVAVDPTMVSTTLHRQQLATEARNVAARLPLLGAGGTRGRRLAPKRVGLLQGDARPCHVVACSETGRPGASWGGME